MRLLFQKHLGPPWAIPPSSQPPPRCRRFPSGEPSPPQSGTVGVGKYFQLLLQIWTCCWSYSWFCWASFDHPAFSVTFYAWFLRCHSKALNQIFSGSNIMSYHPIIWYDIIYFLYMTHLVQPIHQRYLVHLMHLKHQIHRHKSLDSLLRVFTSEPSENSWSQEFSGKLA